MTKTIPNRIQIQKPDDESSKPASPIGEAGLFFYWTGLYKYYTGLRDAVQAWDISVIHTGFNLIATAVLMPLNGLLVKLAYLLVPEVKEPEKTELLDSRLLATPAVAVQRAHEIASEMAADAAKAMHFRRFIRIGGFVFLI